MTLLSKSKPEIIEAIIKANIRTEAWHKKAKGVYEVTLKEDGSEGRIITSLTDDDFNALDPRLAEVVGCIYEYSTNQIVSHSQLALTLYSHWKRDNHVLDVVPTDSWYSRSLVNGKEATWYIDEFYDIASLHTKEKSVRIRMRCYRVEKTDSGVEYVVKKLPAHADRPVVWLDKHFSHGADVLNVVDTLELTYPERGSYIQCQYLKTIGVASIDSGIILNNLTF